MVLPLLNGSHEIPRRGLKLFLSEGAIARPKREGLPAPARPFSSLPVPRISAAHAAVRQAGIFAGLKSAGSNDVSTLFASLTGVKYWYLTPKSSVRFGRILQVSCAKNSRRPKRRFTVTSN